MIYDTLRMARRLEARSRERAIALTEALANSAQDTIATKEDVGGLRAELKEEIAKLRADSIEIKAEPKGDIAGLKGELIRWIVGAIVLNPLGTAGLVIASTRILAHESAA